MALLEWIQLEDHSEFDLDPHPLRKCEGLGLLPPSGAARCLRTVAILQYPLDTSAEQWVRECLGEDIGQLSGGVDLDETHLPILDHFMREMLADVDVLRPLTSADNMVAPFDARRLVLIYRSIGVLGEAKAAQAVNCAYLLHVLCMLSKTLPIHDVIGTRQSSMPRKLPR